ACLPRAPVIRSAPGWLHLFLCLGLGAALSFVSLVFSAEILVHASRWDTAISESESVDERVASWGWPIAAVVDRPTQGVRGKREVGREWDWSSGLLNVALWGLLVALAFDLRHAARGTWRVRQLQPRINTLARAALVAPGAVFLWVLAFLPLHARSAAGGISIGRAEILRDWTDVALLAWATTCGAIFVVGLPMAWRWAKTSRFERRRVLTLGLVLGAVPLLPVLLSWIGLATQGQATTTWADAGLSMVFVFIATGGGFLCACAFWCSTSSRSQPPRGP
ncbi:MAG: hypothetical protein AAGN46_14150, partial [Acidobacteriota bacterium]